MEIAGVLVLMGLMGALLVVTNWYALKALPGNIEHWLRQRNIRVRRPRLSNLSGLFRRTDWEAEAVRITKEDKR